MANLADWGRVMEVDLAQCRTAAPIRQVRRWSALAPTGTTMSAPHRPVERIDARLVREGLAADLKTAAALVLGCGVMVGERKAQTAGDKLPSELPLRLRGGSVSRYVSRGGIELEGALRGCESIDSSL